VSVITRTYARDGAVKKVDGLAYPPGKDAVVWVDVRAPSEEEIGLLQQAFGLHELAVEDAVQAHQRPKLDRYQDQVFVAAYTADLADDRLRLDEVGLFVGRDYLVSFSHGPDGQWKELERRLDEAPKDLHTRPAFLLYAALDQTVDGYFAAVDSFADEIGRIEETILADGSETDIQRRVFGLRRDVLLFRRVVAPLREVIGTIVRADAVVKDPSLEEYFRDLYDHVVRVYEELDTDHDLLGAALEAHLTVISNRLNEVVLKVSGWAAIIAVPTVIASIYGMNYALWPFHVGSHAGFWFSVVLMAASAAGLYGAFSRRGWL
jgi:magnesium transporter